MSLLQSKRERLGQLARRDDGDGDGEDDDCDDDCKTKTTSSAPAPSPPSPLRPQESSTSSISSTSTTSSTTFTRSSSITSSTRSTSTSSTLTSFTPSQTGIFTTTSTSTASFALASTSTLKIPGLVTASAPSVEPFLTSASPTPSSAAQGIQDTSYQSNDTQGFFVGIGVAIGGSLAILTALIYYMYKRRYATSSSTQTTNDHDRGAGAGTTHSLWGGASNRFPNHSTNQPHSQMNVSPFSTAERGYVPWRNSSIQSTPGPTVPEKSVIGDPPAIAFFHPDPFSKHPVIHGPAAPVGFGAREGGETLTWEVKSERPDSIHIGEPLNNEVTISTGILRDSKSDMGYQTTPHVPANVDSKSGKVRAVSAPVGVNVLQLARQQELERELEVERMGKMWESARKRGTGQPEGSVTGASEFSLPRWRDPISWVKDQRARMAKGRLRLPG